MKSVFYFTLSYSGGVQQELDLWRVFSCSVIRLLKYLIQIRYSALLWDFDIFGGRGEKKNHLKYTHSLTVEEIKETKA